MPRMRMESTCLIAAREEEVEKWFPNGAWGWHLQNPRRFNTAIGLERLRGSVS